jgi:hypothetical protein
MQIKFIGVHSAFCDPKANGATIKSSCCLSTNVLLQVSLLRRMKVVEHA